MAPCCHGPHLKVGFHLLPPLACPPSNNCAQAGMAALIFDYRGFGGSDGEVRHWVSWRRHLEVRGDQGRGDEVRAECFA